MTHIFYLQNVLFTPDVIFTGSCVLSSGKEVLGNLCFDIRLFETTVINSASETYKSNNN